ncbi:MAG: amidase [Candidatus Marinimicrobia bacterium CG_4_10_14_0_2_um_filter_48_9]|nr:MAG: amidase [Candidatus Marinimicrobia bacterium CG_4_10_14_0_2_um_filter_48_9]
MSNEKPSRNGGQSRVQRRDFLKYSAAGSVIAATVAAGGFTGVLASCSKDEKEAVPTPVSHAFEYAEYSVSEIQALFESGKLNSRNLTAMYLERIAKIDQNGPQLKAVIEINPEALVIAEALDAERKQGLIRGPLHGVPVLLKDNIGTADQMQTTAGSLALMNAQPHNDAFLVKKLREAGAVILGKTNLSEWANFRDNISSSGWSGRGGQTKNPYALDRNPCGSSSGSAVAVAANMTMLAVGTETNGSVVCPASINGIVGIKPTLGLVSRSGIIPIAHSQDTAGPMARTVKDAAYLLGVMTGADSADEITVTRSGQQLGDYVKFLAADGLNGARIGIARQYFGFHPGVDTIMEQAVEVMKNAGAVIIDPVEIKTYGDFGSASFEVLLYEFKADLNKYLGGLDKTAEIHSLEELIEYNKTNASKEMPFFGQDLLEMAQKKGSLDSQEYKTALEKAKRLAGPEGIDAALIKDNLDALIAPSNGPAWLTDHVTGDHFQGGSSSPAAVAGYPNITVPAGDILGLPIGISFFGAAFSEPRLLRIAYGFEQQTKHRVVPDFKTTVDI